MSDLIFELHLQMLNLDVNPFCWKVGWDISRFVGSLSLTTEEGSVIPVENLSEDIQVSVATLQHPHLLFSISF